MGLMLLDKPTTQEDVQDAILELSREFDVHVIPCGKDKRPLVPWKHYQENKPTEQDIEKWIKQHPDCMWGAVTGKNFGVVDLDTYQDDSLIPWAKENLPWTPLKATTKSGGQHWMYSKMPENTTVSAGSGIDLRNKGGYVIFSGPGYEWNWQDPTEDFFNFRELPELEPQHIEKIEKRRGKNKVTNILSDESWHDNALRWVGSCVARGLGDDTILRECEKLTQAGYSHSQTREEIRVMIKGARLKGWTPPIDDRPIEVLRIDDAFDLEHRKPPEFLGEGFIAAGFRVFVVGAPKIGKSQLVLEALTTAAVGGQWLDMKWDKPHKTLWLQAEIRGAYVGSRLRPLFESFNDDEKELIRENFFWTERGDLDLASNFNRLKALIKRIQPSIVCIDPLANYFVGDENSNAEVAVFFKKLNELFASETLGMDAPPCVFLVHHTRKGATTQDGFDGARGASSLTGWMDSGILMTAANTSAINLSFLTRNGPWPEERLVKLNPDSMRLENFVDAVEHPQMLPEIMKSMAHRDWVSAYDVNGLIAEQCHRLGLEVDGEIAREIRLTVVNHKHIEHQGTGQNTEYRLKPKVRRGYQ